MSKKTYGKATFYTENDIYYCVINYRNHKFIGSTKCVPDDKEYERENIGYTIAEYRAEIKRLQYLRELTKVEAQALKHLRETSKAAETNVYHHLLEQIHQKEQKIELITESINDLRSYVETYIAQKNAINQWLKARENEGIKE